MSAFTEIKVFMRWRVREQGRISKALLIDKSVLVILQKCALNFIHENFREHTHTHTFTCCKIYYLKIYQMRIYFGINPLCSHHLCLSRICAGHILTGHVK